MTTFICVFEPTTEARTNNGAVPLTIALNAANAKIAAATAMIKLSEVFPDSMDNFNVDEPIICEDAVGSPALHSINSMKNLLLKMSLTVRNGNQLSIKNLKSLLLNLA
ncbi:hypothetical protein [Providencia hangzhouensis]|uniref:hypothetical protein n=1 Tax=Providencia hangzhouensis TaxID=3031799 RepID=UPI0034DD66AC